MLKAIVFDYDGVPVDDLKIHEEAYLFAAKRHNRPLWKETVERYVSYGIDKKRPFYGIDKDACCYVGDSLLDVQMSKSAGVVTVFGVATGHDSLDELRHAGADYAVNRLSEVEGILMG